MSSNFSGNGRQRLSSQGWRQPAPSLRSHVPRGESKSARALKVTAHTSSLPVQIIRLSEYSPEVGAAVRRLLIELSRSGRDRGEVPEEWFLEIINSPYHDLIVAEEDGEILGMATVSITMGAGIRKNAYVEDFVVKSSARGKGVGGKIWEEILAWGREKGAKQLEFTSGEGREAAWHFYQKRGAEIYKTNFFRKEL